MTGPHPVGHAYATRCRGERCRAAIEVVVVGHRNGKSLWHPFNLDALGRPARTSHFLTCPDADAFGGRGRAIAYPQPPAAAPPDPQRRLPS